MTKRFVYSEDVPGYTPQYHICMDGAEEEYKKKSGRVLRVAHAEELPWNTYGRARSECDPRQQVLLEEWFPGEIFDDVLNVFDVFGPGFQLNEEKLKTWYAQQTSEAQQKFKRSLEGVHRMIEDGFMFDLYGPQNFGIKDGEFVLIDVEPIQISNLPQVRTLPYSQDIINTFFRVVGLEPISYETTVSKPYGDDKYIEFGKMWMGSAQEAYVPLQSYYTNISHAEELAHYRRVFEKMRAERQLPPRTDINPELARKFYHLLSLPDSYFDGIRYDRSFSKDIA